MRLKIMAVESANKAINRARIDGKLSLVPVAKLNMLRYYMEFAVEQIGLGKETYKDTYQTLVNKYNTLALSCPDIICNVDEESCGTGGDYTIPSTTIRNPYNPTVPTTPTEPEPEPDTHTADITDITIYPEYNVQTTLTLDMFTAKYTDSEGHTFDAVRIDSINTTNLGIFYVGGIAITTGQIISDAQINAGDFYHVGSDAQAIISDSFTFSVRDAVTGEWID